MRVTGGGGLMGRAWCPARAGRGHRGIAGRRRDVAGAPPIAGAAPCLLGTIAPGREWGGELRDVDIVIHLAQRAHRRAAQAIIAGEPEAAAALARAAVGSGVRRFVSVSSIKAIGEATAP